MGQRGQEFKKIFTRFFAFYLTNISFSNLALNDPSVGAMMLEDTKFYNYDLEEEENGRKISL